MSEFMGTPAPWSRNGNAVFNDDGYDIAHLTYGEYTGIKEDEANTNLIAAAPELLEALIEARVWVQGWNAAHESEESYKALIMCNKAIDRALGQ